VKWGSSPTVREGALAYARATVPTNVPRGTNPAAPVSKFAAGYVKTSNLVYERSESHAHDTCTCALSS